jgi:hypothetical protein
LSSSSSRRSCASTRTAACRLDKRHGTTLAFAGDKSRHVLQVSLEHALHHAQHRRDQAGLRGQQQPQRDRQRQHPLPYRHERDDVIDPMRRRLRHAPRTARRADPAPLATERLQRVVAAPAAAQSHPARAMRGDRRIDRDGGRRRRDACEVEAPLGAGDQFAPRGAEAPPGASCWIHASIDPSGWRITPRVR